MRGTKGVGNVRDPKAFMQATVAAKKVLADNAVTGQGLPKFGTQVLMNVINEIGALPTRNHRDVQFEGAKDISAEAMHEPRKTRRQAEPRDQPGLLRLHDRVRPHLQDRRDPLHGASTVREYWGASGGLEYEAAWALGAANGVNDLEALTYANFVCNEDGFDPISFGATVGAVMELYEMGVLDEGAARHRGAVRIGAGAHLLRGDHRARRRLRQRDRPGLEAAYGEVRPSRPVDERQRPGISGLRLARHPGHGPRVRHVEPRRLPLARLHGRLGGSRHPDEDRSARHRQARPAW